MKLLAIDGNSIVNRAFYGIKLLTTKDGKYYTNAVYGFLNILLKLSADINPDAVAVAFDVKEPTFRHKMYEGYKANRHGMPEELASQMPVLKEIIAAMGYKILEAPGWEADDILGTLAGAAGEDDFCYIATGDRDSLQLVSDNVNVLLASTKMGNTVTTRYDSAKIKEDYLVDSPALLIDIKALQGDSSDCIPGVAGIGEKTAKDLVSKFGTIDDIYGNIETIDIKPGIRLKLEKDRDMAYLSRTLGTISREAPVDKSYGSYIPGEADVYKLTSILSQLEMYKMIERLNLKAPASVSAAQPGNEDDTPEIKTEAYKADDLKLLLNSLRKEKKAYFVFDNGVFFFKTENGTALAEPENDGYLEFCEDFLFDKEIEKYTYNAKHLYSFFYDYRVDLEINNICGDAMLSAYIINPSGEFTLKRITEEYAGIISENTGDTAFCTAYLEKSFKKLDSVIENNGQRELINNIELPLSRVLASMEREGFQVDIKGIEDFGKMLSEKTDNLVAEIYNEVGYEFNLNSPKQLGEALFEKMGIPAKKKTKTGYSTNAEVLESLAPYYPVVSKILEYRSYTKLKSTYCDGLLKVVGDDGRVHSSLNQTETRTGRISSSEPNLQNIPVRTQLGKEMRRYFKAKDGYTLIDADYSQIELRVLAHMANDKNMIAAFNDGDDIHAITASQVFDMPLMMVTPLMRSRAKAVNFGIVYGIGAFSLSKNTGVSVPEAKEYIENYLSHFSGVRDYMKQVIENARKNGYVETIYNRRRYLPEINNSNGNIRAGAERMAMNMPVQGTAADIIKIAMIRVYDALEKMNFKAKLILQVHDELIVEAPDDEAEAVSAILKKEMENAVKMKVSLTADVGCGKTWYEAKS